MQQAATVKPKKPATKGETLIGLVVLVGVVWAVGAWCSSLSSVTKNTAPVPLTLNAFPALKQLLSGQNNDTPAKPKLRDFRITPIPARSTSTSTWISISPPT